MVIYDGSWVTHCLLCKLAYASFRAHINVVCHIVLMGTLHLLDSELFCTCLYIVTINSSVSRGLTFSHRQRFHRPLLVAEAPGRALDLCVCVRTIRFELNDL